MIFDSDYAKAYTIARIIAWQYGWAVTLHGSFTRDLDIVLVPWTEKAAPAEGVIHRIADLTKLKLATQEPGKKPHGRLAWTLLFPEFDDPRWIDISVMPRVVAEVAA